MTKLAILFRCDGTENTGLGHVSRCLALAEALQELGACCRFVGNFGPSACALFMAAGMEFDLVNHPAGGDADRIKTAQIARSFGACGLVLDSYSVDASYVRELQREACPLLLIDDFGLGGNFGSRALINFTVGGEDLYVPDPDALFLLGPANFLVRRRIRHLRRHVRTVPPKATNLLVAIGGTDRHHVSQQILEALSPHSRRFAVRVIISRSCSEAGKLATQAGRFQSGSALKVQLPDLADEFDWAHICICGGGLTKYESAYLGLPVAVLSQTQEQADETVHFSRRGLGLDWGMAEQADPLRLEGRILALANDAELRTSLGRAGLSAFPEDPTLQAAAAWLKTIA